ncbi:MAG: LemA family protein [Actinobacteria bacterium]|nr:LemA family protein [Actinomycetota bacterium]
MLIVLGLLLLIVIYLAAVYNRLVNLKNQLKNAWHQIDVQLKRRYDLIPNLVETVKAYASHEKEIFEKVAQARSAAINASTVKEQSEAENALTSTLKTLFAVAENYPDLKASENFMMLQEELSSTENKIAYARQFYNDSVMRFNTYVQSFPSNIIARIFGFKEEDYFEIEEVESKPIEVKF